MSNDFWKGWSVGFWVAIVIVLLVMLMVALIGGCSPPVTLYPIQGHDFYIIKAGDCNAVVDGYFMSEFYLNEVLEAKVR
jgi:hypothetical protein